MVETERTVEGMGEYEILVNGNVTWCVENKAVLNIALLGTRVPTTHRLEQSWKPTRDIFVCNVRFFSDARRHSQQAKGRENK